MNIAFVDTNYWLATFNPLDQWHDSAVEAKNRLGPARLVTTESVLIEVLNYSGSLRQHARLMAAGSVRDILSDRDVETILHTHAAFLDALSLYENRRDKGYSLTDCISMNVMRARGITAVLTHDNHFVQEGFNILL